MHDTIIEGAPTEIGPAHPDVTAPARRRWATRIIAGLVGTIGLYALWAHAGRGGVPLDAAAPPLEFQSFRQDRGAGNLLGLQVAAHPRLYASERHFYDGLDRYLEAARREGLLGAKTVAVFPEHVGTWLVVADEKTSVYDAPSIDAGMERLVLSNLFSFLGALSQSDEADRARAALFRMKSEKMAEIYDRSFRRLAQAHGITVVAGSIVLAAPRVEAGRIVVGDGPLMNVSAVYGPDGLAGPLVKKRFLVADEQRFLAAPHAAPRPSFETPAGRLGVLICADSWFPESYAALKETGIDLLAVPSFIPTDGHWTAAWGGYDGHPAPADVRPIDVGRLTEGEAWLRYAMPGRIPSSQATAGLNVYLRGKLWDLGSAGQSLVWAGRAEQATPEAGALINLWLDDKRPVANTPSP